MTMLDPLLLPASRRDLAAQLAELDRTLADHQVRLYAELHQWAGDIDVSDLLDDDVALSDDADRELTWLLLRHVQSQRSDVAVARARLADGSYGRCTACAGSIGLERLEILPAASTCVRCAP